MIWGHNEVIAQDADRVVVRVVNLDFILTCIALVAAQSRVILRLREPLGAFNIRVP